MIHKRPLRSRQVLTNGLSNAMKHAENVDLSITYKHGGGGSGSDAVAARVLDDGPGLQGVDTSKLFDDFAAAATSVVGGRRGSESVKGSGLGLPICSRLAALMGGTLTVRDRTDGARGAEFTLTLPCDLGSANVSTPIPEAVPRDFNYSAGTTDHAAIRMTLTALDRAAAKAPVTPPAAAPRSRIVVVDDAPLNRRIAARYLALLGHECVTLTDGDEVAGAVAAAPADIILMDIRMARMDWDVACRGLRAAGYTAPIIAVCRRAPQDCISKLQACSVPAWRFEGRVSL